MTNGLKVTCLFMITEVSIRCQKKPGGWYTAYTRVYPPPNTPLHILLGTGAVILPQQRNLQWLSSVLTFVPGVQSSEHEQMRYLRLKAQSLTDPEKYVVLQIDEIHVMQSLQYRGGHITGVAENATTEQANSIQAFLIASVAGSLREIVSFVPVTQLMAGKLKDMIMIKCKDEVLPKCIWLFTGRRHC